MRAEAELNAVSTEWSLPQALRAAYRTEASRTQLFLRVVLGAVLFPHGAQHLFGWFGGYGFDGTLGWMVSIGIPAPVAAFAIVTEFVAPVLLLLGLGGRLAGVLLAGFMAGAAATHLGDGFFMNWFGALPAGAEGFEYHLLAIALALAVAARGSGSLSIDRVLSRR